MGQGESHAAATGPKGVLGGLGGFAEADSVSKAVSLLSICTFMTSWFDS